MLSTQTLWRIAITPLFYAYTINWSIVLFRSFSWLPGFFSPADSPPPFGSKDNVRIVRQSLIHFIKLYLLWTVIYLPLAIIYWNSTGLPLRTCISQYMRSFLFVGQQYNSWMLWYLLSTIYTLIVIMACLRQNRSRIHLLLVACISISLNIALNYLSAYTKALPPILNCVREVLLETIRNGRLLSGMFYIPVGMLLWNTETPPKFAFPLFFVLFILCCLSKRGIVRTPLSILSYIALFASAKGSRLPAHPVYPILRKVSTGMYFIHLYVWTIYYTLVYHQKTYGSDCFIAATLISASLSLLYTLYCRKVSTQTSTTPIRRKD